MDNNVVESKIKNEVQKIVESYRDKEVKTINEEELLNKLEKFNLEPLYLELIYKELGEAVNPVA